MNFQNFYKILGILFLTIFPMSSTFAQKAPIKIGVITSLTGPYGVIGKEIVEVVQYAVDEANAAGGVDGRKVEVSFADSEGKPDIARQRAEQQARSGYNLMTGLALSSEPLALGPMLDRWNALYVASIPRADAITGAQCQRLLFRANRPDYSEVQAARAWFKSRPEKRWAILAADYAWGHGSNENITKALNDLGREIVSRSFVPLGTTDFSAYIKKIQNANAEGLWVTMAGQDALTFIRQSKQFGLTDKIVIAGTGYATETTVKSAGSAAEGLYVIQDYAYTASMPENKTFIERWSKKFPEPPTNFQGEQYITMQVIFQAVAKAGSVEPRDVAKAMEGAEFHTILGKQKMRAEDHQLVGPIFFGRVQRDSVGTLRPISVLTVDATTATPGPDPSCKLR